MVTAQELLRTLRERGCEVWAEGDRLHARIPKAVLTDELQERVAQHKAELLALVMAESVLELARRLGWPRFELLRDRWTPSDEAGWRDFIATAPREDVELAAEILRCRVAEGVRATSVEEQRRRSLAQRLLWECGKHGVTVAVESGRLHVEANDPAKRIPESLAEGLRRHEADVVGVIQRGDALLKAVWSHRYTIRLTRPRPDWIVIVPRGPGRNEDQVLRMFFSDHRDAAALFASRLPWSNGQPDTDWWNRTSDALESGRLRLRSLPPDHPKDPPK